jgi:hypothetical protein
MKTSVFWDVSRVALVRTKVSEELNTSFIRVTRIGELGTTLASNRRTLRRNTYPVKDRILVGFRYGYYICFLVFLEK